MVSLWFHVVGLVVDRFRGFGVVPVFLVWLGVRVWHHAQRRGTALVRRRYRRQSMPLVVVFSWRWGAAMGMVLGFGVGVQLSVVVRRRGLYWRRGSVSEFSVVVRRRGSARHWRARRRGLASGFGLASWFGVGVCLSVGYLGFGVRVWLGVVGGWRWGLLLDTADWRRGLTSGLASRFGSMSLFGVKVCVGVGLASGFSVGFSV